jgi:hypothetical protein
MADKQARLVYEERISRSEQCCEGYGYDRDSARKGKSVSEPNDSTSSYLLIISSWLDSSFLNLGRDQAYPV